MIYFDDMTITNPSKVIETKMAKIYVKKPEVFISFVEIAFKFCYSGFIPKNIKIIKIYLK